VLDELQTSRVRGAEPRSLSVKTVKTLRLTAAADGCNLLFVLDAFTFRFRAWAGSDNHFASRAHTGSTDRCSGHKQQGMLALHVKIPGAASAISFEAVRQKVFAKRWGAGERDRSRNALQKVVFSIADPVAVRDHDGLLRNFTTCCEDRCQRYDAALARAGVRTQISEA
jgi:hypothetical protein